MTPFIFSPEQHTLRASADGTVGRVHAAQGELVAQKALLLTFGEEEGGVR
tara:strand:+ start:98 stop:247 length:150 start_codon:yes stop_codon:yes gene_type:complete